MNLKKLIQGWYLKKLRLQEFSLEVKICGEDAKDARLKNDNSEECRYFQNKQIFWFYVLCEFMLPI